MDELEEVRLLKGRDHLPSRNYAAIQEAFRQRDDSQRAASLLFAPRLIRSFRRRQLAHQGLNFEKPSRKRERNKSRPRPPLIRSLRITDNSRVLLGEERHSDSRFF